MVYKSAILRRSTKNHTDEEAGRGYLCSSCCLSIGRITNQFPYWSYSEQTFKCLRSHFNFRVGGAAADLRHPVVIC